MAAFSGGTRAGTRIVNSPLGSVKYSKCAYIGHTTTSSCALVSSRPTPISLSEPSRLAKSVKVRRIRWGASKKTARRVLEGKFASHKFLSFDLFGGKPRETQSPASKPATA